MTDERDESRSESETKTVGQKIADRLTTEREGYKYQPNNNPLPEGGGASTAEGMRASLSSRGGSLFKRTVRGLFVENEVIGHCICYAATAISGIVVLWFVFGVLGLTFVLPTSPFLMILAVMILFLAIVNLGYPLHRGLNMRTRKQINSEQETVAAELLAESDGQVTPTITTSTDDEEIERLYETLGAPGSLEEVSYKPATQLDLSTGSLVEEQIHMLEVEMIEEARGDALIGSLEEQLLEQTEDRNLILDQLAAVIGEEGTNTDGIRYSLQVVVAPRKHDKHKSSRWAKKYTKSEQSAEEEETGDLLIWLTSEISSQMWKAITGEDTERAQAHARTKAECNFNIAVRAIAITDGNQTKRVDKKFNQIENVLEATLDHRLTTTSTRFHPGEQRPLLDRLLHNKPREELVRRFNEQAVGQRPLTIGARLHPKRRSGLIDDKRNIWSYLVLSNETTPKAGRVTGSRPRDQSGKQRPSDEHLDSYRSRTDDPYDWDADPQTGDSDEHE